MKILFFNTDVKSSHVFCKSISSFRIILWGDHFQGNFNNVFLFIWKYNDLKWVFYRGVPHKSVSSGHRFAHIRLTHLTCTRRYLKCPNKHIDEIFCMWWHFRKFLKCPKIEHFQFSSFFCSKADHVLNFWNAQFSNEY